jgi:hypothetical protein
MDESMDVVLDVHDGYIDIEEIFKRAAERVDLNMENLPDKDAGTEEGAKDG